MLDSRNEVRKLISSLVRYFETEGNLAVVEILRHADASIESEYDSWNGGTYTYSVFLEMEVDLYNRHRALLSSYEEDILKAAQQFLRGEINEGIGRVIIRPICRHYLDWSALGSEVNKTSVLQAMSRVKSIMVAVSTGGPRIAEKNSDYISRYKELATWLDALGLENPNPHKDLWDWYGRWGQKDLPSYASRRSYVSELYEGTVETVETSSSGEEERAYTPTGWERVDRTVYEMKRRLSEAVNEEQFQAIGMLGREAIITISQQVFDKNVHKTEDGSIPSEADAKRMLDAYLNSELAGESNERVKKYARASLDLANHVTHDRLATQRDAAICLVAVTSLADTVRVVSRRSPGAS